MHLVVFQGKATERNILATFCVVLVNVSAHNFIYTELGSVQDSTVQRMQTL